MGAIRRPFKRTKESYFHLVVPSVVPRDNDASKLRIYDRLGIFIRGIVVLTLQSQKFKFDRRDISETCNDLSLSSRSLSSFFPPSTFAYPRGDGRNYFLLFTRRSRRERIFSGVRSGEIGGRAPSALSHFTNLLHPRRDPSVPSLSIRTSVMDARCAPNLILKVTS